MTACSYHFRCWFNNIFFSSFGQWTVNSISGFKKFIDLFLKKSDGKKRKMVDYTDFNPFLFEIFLTYGMTYLFEGCAKKSFIIINLTIFSVYEPKWTIS